MQGEFCGKRALWRRWIYAQPGGSNNSVLRHATRRLSCKSHEDERLRNICAFDFDKGFNFKKSPWDKIHFYSFIMIGKAQKDDGEKFGNLFFVVCFCHPAVARQNWKEILRYEILCRMEFPSRAEENLSLGKFSVRIEAGEMSFWILNLDVRLKQLVKETLQGCQSDQALGNI